MNTLRTQRIAARRSMLGVTLLELMAVVMVIGILGMIAIPSYRQYVMRAQRTEAKAALLQLQTNQERFYLANRTYGTVAQLDRGELADGRCQVGARNATTLTIAGSRRHDLHGDGDADGRRRVRHDERRAVHVVLDHGAGRSHGHGHATAATCW